MQKIFLAFKKISKSPEKFCDFFRLVARDHESIASTESPSEKKWPLTRIEEPPGFLTTFFFVNVFGICFQLRNDLLDGKTCQPSLSSGGATAELRFHVIDIIRGIKALRIGPDEIERGITRRISPLV